MLKFELDFRCVARLKFELVLKCVARLTASREAPLGRRVSECIVAFRVWGVAG